MSIQYKTQNVHCASLLCLRDLAQCSAVWIAGISGCLVQDAA